MNSRWRSGRFADFFIRLWREKPLGAACGMIVLLFIVVALFTDVLVPYSYREMHLADILQAPSVQYLLGTNHLGRDLLNRLLYGARISLYVGLAATALNVLIVVLIGGTSGYLREKVDLAVQRFVDTWMAFPGLLLLLTVMSIVGQGLLQIIVVLGVDGGVGGSRVIRDAVVGIKENDYFLAARKEEETYIAALRSGKSEPLSGDPSFASYRSFSKTLILTSSQSGRFFLNFHTHHFLNIQMEIQIRQLDDQSVAKKFIVMELVFCGMSQFFIPGKRRRNNAPIR